MSIRAVPPALIDQVIKMATIDCLLSLHRDQRPLCELRLIVEDEPAESTLLNRPSASLYCRPPRTPRAGRRMPRLTQSIEWVDAFRAFPCWTTVPQSAYAPPTAPTRTMARGKDRHAEHSRQYLNPEDSRLGQRGEDADMTRSSVPLRFSGNELPSRQWGSGCGCRPSPRVPAESVRPPRV